MITDCILKKNFLRHLTATWRCLAWRFSFLLLKSYLTDRGLYFWQEDANSDLTVISAGSSQRSVRVYMLFINDTLKTLNTTLATFADNTAILTTLNTQKICRRLQPAVNWVANLIKNLWITLNVTKSTLIYLAKIDENIIFINGRGQATKTYQKSKDTLGTWRQVLIKWTAEEKSWGSYMILRKMYSLLGRNTELATRNKILLYKQTYQFWHMASRFGDAA